MCMDNVEDDNLLLFVFLHELTHIGSECDQHEPEFWDNFKFLM